MISKKNDEFMMRIEALVASPPTQKCKAILAMFEKIVQKYPDMVHADVYYAGTQPSVIPTKGFQRNPNRKKIPSVYVNGRPIAQGEVPEESTLMHAVQEELQKGERKWQ